MKTNFLLIVLGAFLFLIACQPTESAAVAETPPSKKGLVKIAIMYPNGEDHTFDMDYYATKHMPMVASLFGEAMIDMEIDKGLAGRTPEDDMPYLAAGYFFFESIEAYNQAFGPNADQILGDIPNYTNIRPVIQISEVVR
ncbi:MAG: EthD family reductase [Bacteroidota bacterium]